jgi:hypothetical protein
MVAATKNPIGHLPVAAVTPTVLVPTAAGNPAAPRVLATPNAVARALVLNGITVNIDLSKHGPQNVVDLINNANIPGVVASLDRYGMLNIAGVAAPAGDPLLLQHLGFN